MCDSTKVPFFLPLKSTSLPKTPSSPPSLVTQKLQQKEVHEFIKQ